MKRMTLDEFDDQRPEVVVCTAGISSGDPTLSRTITSDTNIKLQIILYSEIVIVDNSPFIKVFICYLLRKSKVML